MYLLDTNVFIEAKNHYYRMNTFPGFWDWMDCCFNSERLKSIQLVYEELCKNKDELSDWIKTRHDHFVLADDEETQMVMANIAQFVMDHSVYKEPYKSNFLNVADPLLIAKAKTSGATIVTHEVLVPSDSTKVKIPNICREFGVDYCNTFELLELLETRFVLHS